jgi:hypothetical protein
VEHVPAAKNTHVTKELVKVLFSIGPYCISYYVSMPSQRRRGRLGENLPEANNTYIYIYKNVTASLSASVSWP